MEKKYIKNEKYYDAVERVREIKEFYSHAIVYVLVNLGISGLIFYANDFRHFQWSFFSVWFFWGIGLAAHGASVFGSNLILGREWEKRKIQELMDEDEENKVRF